MVAPVESRLAHINRLLRTIEWLSDNGSGYIATETRNLAREIGLEPMTTPVTSLQSNGIAETLLRTIKRDYAGVHNLPDAQTVLETLLLWFEHYNRVRAVQFSINTEEVEGQVEVESGLITCVFDVVWC